MHELWEGVVGFLLIRSMYDSAVYDLLGAV